MEFKLTEAGDKLLTPGNAPKGAYYTNGAWRYKIDTVQELLDFARRIGEELIIMPVGVRRNKENEIMVYNDYIE